MMCFVPYCTHYSHTRSCKLFRFPKDPKERAKWIKAIRRKDRQPKYTSSRVCSCHFRGGEKNNGPSIFPWNESKVFSVNCPVKKRPRGKEIESLALANSTMYNDDSNVNTKSTQTINSIQNEAELTLLRAEVEQIKTEIENLKKRPFSLLCNSKNDHLITLTNYQTSLIKIDEVSSSYNSLNSDFAQCEEDPNVELVIEEITEIDNLLGE